MVDCNEKLVLGLIFAIIVKFLKIEEGEGEGKYK